MGKKIALWSGVLASLIAVIAFGQHEYSKLAKAEDIKALHESIKSTNESTKANTIWIKRNQMKADLRFYEQRLRQMESDHGAAAKNMNEYKCLDADIERLKIELQRGGN